MLGLTQANGKNIQLNVNEEVYDLPKVQSSFPKFNYSR